MIDFSKKHVYNEDGIRTSKTVNNVKTTFLLDGYNIIEQTDGTTTLHFFYDSNGEVIGFRHNGNDYFYVKNAMSDIIAITDSNKNIVAEYRYDPWGKVKLLSKKEAIEEKYGLYSDVTDTILDLAEELVGIVAALYTGDVYMYEQAKQVFNKIRNYSEYLEILLSLCEKYRDKEDRYITSILKKYSNNKSNVLILLSRLDYAYTTRSYQRGIYWVCQTGWFSQKKVNVY